MSLPNILYQGSVKDIRGDKDLDTPLIFDFSDRYSIFDWGQMPDSLANKGKSLAVMAWAFFDYLKNNENWQDWDIPKNINVQNIKQQNLLNTLRDQGLPTHSLGLSDGQGNILKGNDVFTSFTSHLSVQRMNVIRPKSFVSDDTLKWDYTGYDNRPSNCLVPLEVIFRFGLPEGSSLLKRAGDAEYCKTLGLSDAPKAGDIFEMPVIEFSTKLENYDRYLSYDDARDIAGMTEAEFLKLKHLTQLTALRLADLFQEMNVKLWDGKFEFAFIDSANDDERDFMIIDSIGPDELRLTYGDVQLSKECLRSVYRDTDWHKAIDEAKDMAEDRNVEDWKTICIEELKQEPDNLNKETAEAISMLYMGFANALSMISYNQNVFPDAWSLEKIAEHISEIKG